MAIIDHIQCGRVIIFNSILFKTRWAFCIDYNVDEQIIYRGIFGLKCIDKKTFLSFARIVDVFDYVDRSLTTKEKIKLKSNYKSGGLMKKCDTVKDFISKLYMITKIEFFINSEKWADSKWN